MGFLQDDFVAELISEGKSEEEIEAIISALGSDELKDTPEIITEARKVAQDAARAFHERRKYTNNRNNTVVKIENGFPHMYLHRNLIAREDETHHHYWQAGWNTPTTNSRLGELTNHSFYSRQPHSSRAIVSINKQTGEKTVTEYDPKKPHHLSTFKLHHKFDLKPTDNPKTKDMFESTKIDVNNLMMKFDKENRAVLAEHLVPSVRAMMKTVKNADHRERLMEEIGRILISNELDARQKYTQVGAILVDPWAALNKN